MIYNCSEGNDKGDNIVSNQKKEAVNQLPENFGDLKKAVNRTADWEERLNAVNELAKFKSDETMKILQYVAKEDLVTKVRETATRLLKQMGQEVQVKVLEVDEAAGKISLSIRALQEAPVATRKDDHPRKSLQARVDESDAEGFNSLKDKLQDWIDKSGQ